MTSCCREEDLKLETETSIQPEESPPGGQEREVSNNVKVHSLCFATGTSSVVRPITVKEIIKCHQLSQRHEL